MNDLTLSADADSDSSESDKRKLSKPRSQQESAMRAAAIVPAPMLPSKS